MNIFMTISEHQEALHERSFRLGEAKVAHIKTYMTLSGSRGSPTEAFRDSFAREDAQLGLQRVRSALFIRGRDPG